MGMCQSPFPYGDLDGAWCVTQWPAKTTVPISIQGVPIWKPMETRRPTKKIPFGYSPLPNRGCAHLGINRYRYQSKTIRGTNYYKREQFFYTYCFSVHLA
jgi:hypothetical protein